ncbi:MAG: 5'-3' exonuclease H3TH domain-containing protein [Planctomycetota bacterium]
MSPSAQLHLVDASPYIFRAFFSLPTSIQSPAGKPVNAVRGFGDFLAKLLVEERPTHVLVAFDGSLTTSFRNDVYPAYKSSRELPDEDLVAQLEACQEVAEALGLATTIDDRYEADDLVATARARFDDDFARFTVVSADKDMTQLVDERTEFYDFGKSQRIGPNGVFEKMGVRPAQVRDLLGLAGDSVDDIPGVRGVGPKTATALLAEFDDLDALYAGLERVAALSIRGAKTLGAKLEAARDDAFLSRELATVAVDAPLPQESPADLRRAPIDRTRLGRIGDELGLDGLLRAATRIEG